MHRGRHERQQPAAGEGRSDDHLCGADGSRIRRAAVHGRRHGRRLRKSGDLHGIGRLHVEAGSTAPRLRSSPRGRARSRRHRPATTIYNRRHRRRADVHCEQTTSRTGRQSHAITTANRGWNNTNVTVTWSWTDAGVSGVDPGNCTTSSVSSGEGDGHQPRCDVQGSRG